MALCERCRAEIETDPLPPGIVKYRVVGVTRGVLRTLWVHRKIDDGWVTLERLVAGAYAGTAGPLHASAALGVAVGRLNRLFLAPGYRIEGRTGPGGGRRLMMPSQIA